MPSQREHARLSRLVLGTQGEIQSLGPAFQALLDRHSDELGPRHRVIDHTWERLNKLADLYGSIGYAEILLHIAADYGLVKRV